MNVKILYITYLYIVIVYIFMNIIDYGWLL